MLSKITVTSDGRTDRQTHRYWSLAVRVPFLPFECRPLKRNFEQRFVIQRFFYRNCFSCQTRLLCRRIKVSYCWSEVVWYSHVPFFAKNHKGTNIDFYYVTFLIAETVFLNNYSSFLYYNYVYYFCLLYVSSYTFCYISTWCIRQSMQHVLSYLYSVSLACICCCYIFYTEIHNS